MAYFLRKGNGDSSRVGIAHRWTNSGYQLDGVEA